jgi:hypothetical protein
MGRIALLATILIACSLPIHAQECARLHYFDVNSDAVYRAGQRVKNEEPHGSYTGFLSADKMNFVCPIKISIKQRGSTAPTETNEHGLVVVSVRRATEAHWTRQTFAYRCEDLSLKRGKMELALFNGTGMQIGSHNAICSLSTGAY